MKGAWPGAAVGLVALTVLGLVSCRSIHNPSGNAECLPDITPTRIDYVDSDGFDALLENSLVNQDPIIVIHTGRNRPDWEGRLNAWIAAWNRGSNTRRRVEAAPVSQVARGQSPLAGVAIDGNTVREFRLLVNDLFERIEGIAQTSGGWWSEERARSRRVSLLRPYSLRFHLDESKQIVLILFHGSYSDYYRRFLELLTRVPPTEEDGWTRGIECSCAGMSCDGRPIRLTNGGGE